MVEIVKSKNGLPIRLTDERWAHITEEHCELAGLREDILETIAEPLRIFQGNQGEFLVLREIHENAFLVVVYRETNEDGLIITAFLTKRIKSFSRRKQIWPT
jgi:hypothetical protein